MRFYLRESYKVSHGIIPEIGGRNRFSPRLKLENRLRRRFQRPDDLSSRVADALQILHDQLSRCSMRGVVIGAGQAVQAKVPANPISHQPSAISYDQSVDSAFPDPNVAGMETCPTAFNFHLSAMSYQPPAISYELSPIPLRQIFLLDKQNTCALIIEVGSHH
jgi:hypothetical protein